MIVQKSMYIRIHVLSAGGICGTVANIVRRLTGITVGDVVSKLIVSAGKRLA
jgi:hypothetical protein